MNQADDAFVEFLRSRSGRTVYLKPFWGNSGDELIWMGNDLLLKELGLRRVFNPNKAEIILIPGGNPTMWESPLAEWQDCWNRWPAAEFVVGPATFLGTKLPWKTMLKTTSAKIAGLFARDPESYQVLMGLGLPSSVQIGLGHDPSFHLKDSQWITELRETCLSEYVLASFRGDRESNFCQLQAGRLSRFWPFSSMLKRRQHRFQAQHHWERMETVRRLSKNSLPLFERDAPLMSFQSFIECVARASQVHTDRLHCMIISLLLGKEVFAYPTAFGKLEGVYAHSIQSWAKVHFVKLPTVVAAND